MMPPEAITGTATSRHISRTSVASGTIESANGPANVPRCAPASAPCATIASDARLLQPARFFNRGRSADNEDAALFSAANCAADGMPKVKLKSGRSLLQHGLQLLLKRIARQWGQERRGQTELGVRFGHDFEHRLRVDDRFAGIAPGKQIDAEWPLVICRMRRIAAAMSSGLE